MTGYGYFSEVNRECSSNYLVPQEVPEKKKPFLYYFNPANFVDILMYNV